LKSFFDSSVLVPVFLDEHIHHQASLKVFVKSDKRNAACAAHSLAEVYSTLTRIPGPQRADANQALLILDTIRDRFEIFALDEKEYCLAIAAGASEGITGGTIYDALIAHCALKAKATTIYTWNVEHFRRCGPEVAKRVRTP
jgi:predicted nucleic acid-binding protein